MPHDLNLKEKEVPYKMRNWQ